MKLSHKLVMVSAAALMGVSPLIGAAQNGNATAMAATKKSTTKKTASKTTTKKSTAKTTSSKKSTTAKKSNSSANTIVLAKNSYVYFGNGKRNKNYSFNGKTWPVIGKTAVLKYSGTKTIDGQLYYNIGNNSYIKASNVGTVDGKKVAASASSNTSKKPSSTSKAKEVTLTRNAYVYDKNGKRIKSVKTLKKGTTVNYTGTKKIKGKNYYNLGKGQYVKTANAKPVAASDDKTKSVELIHNAYVYDKNGKRIKGSGVLKKGNTVKYYSTVKIKGKSYYNLGKGQYVKTANAKKVEVDEVKSTYITLARNAAIYDENGEHVTDPGTDVNSVRLKGTSFLALDAKKINGKWYYKIGTNQWIKAANVGIVDGPALIPESEDPSAGNTETVTPDADTAVITLSKTSHVYTSKGVTDDTQTFAAGRQLRVKALTWLWIPSQNKAIQCYQLANKPYGYINIENVSSVNGKQLTANNTQQDAEDAAKTATASDKTGLAAAINAAAQVKASDAYKLSPASVQNAYDEAISKGTTINNSSTSTIKEVKDALSLINETRDKLSGRKVQVANVNQLTPTEADEVIKLVASLNGVDASQVKFDNGNNNLVITSSNGYQTTVNVADYVTTLPVNNF